MGRVGSVVVAALAATLTLSPGTSSAVGAPPTTPPPAAAPTTQDDSPASTTQPEQRPRRTTTTTIRPTAGSIGNSDDDGSWSVQRIAVTGAIAIAGLALLGWAVARIRNALARPTIR